MNLETQYRAVLAGQPEDIETNLALASLLVDADRDLADAEKCAETVVRLVPEHQPANMLLGLIYGRMGRFAKAAQFSARAFILSGKQDAAAASNLVAALDNLEITPGILAVLEDVVEAQADNANALLMLIHASRQVCRWDGLDDRVRRLLELIEGVEDISLSPFKTLGLPGMSPARQRTVALKHGLLSAKVYAVAVDHGAPAAAAPPPRAGARLRIGYFSSDFHEHPTSFLLAGVLEHHDRSEFDVHAFSVGHDSSDPMRGRIRSAVETFHDLSRLSPLERFATIRAANTDILIDLNGWTHRKRFEMPQLRLAPVMVNWLGYPGTMGLPEMADYLIGDPTVTPLEHAPFYSEKLALLPQCYQPNDAFRAIGARPSRVQAGLPGTGFVFCSFNTADKITREVFEVWCRLLDGVPGSVLWLLAPSKLAQENLVREAAGRGVAAHRLVFAPRLDLKSHLGRLQLAGLALDTLPYNSHTTGSDALWAGVPMVTCLGEGFASRVGASLLKAVGLPECIATNLDEYFEVALSLARNPARLTALRDRLTRTRSTNRLFDTEGFTRDLEALYTRMWDDHLAGVTEAIAMPAH